MSTFGNKQQQSAVPQQPLPVMASHHDPGFLPTYEETLNDNLCNFEKLEGQIGKGIDDQAQLTQRRTSSRNKRCCLLSLPLLLMLVAGICVVAIAFRRHEQHTSSTSPATTTQYHTTTVIETSTASASIPGPMASAISSFYDKRTDILATFTSTIWFGSESDGWSMITTTVPKCVAQSTSLYKE